MKNPIWQRLLRFWEGDGGLPVILALLAVTIFVSPVSLYELYQKQVIGRLPQAEGLIQNIDRRMIDYDFRYLPITARHAIRAASLDWDHRDPFDRLLVAQAMEDSCTIVTTDHRIHESGVPTLW